MGAANGRTVKCTACHREFMLLEWKDGTVLNNDQPSDRATDLSCPDCGCEERRTVVGVASAVGTGGEHGVGRIFPYFDRTLGLEVRSAKHRAQLCAERGIVPLDGGMDSVIKGYNEQSSRDQAARDRAKRTTTMYEESPDFADFRRLRDKGFYADQFGRGQG
jgi:hypothetical protein